ncbi:MAG: DUF4185 domain-containing protein [Candidatus Odinarchaeota archaeon]
MRRRWLAFILITVIIISGISVFVLWNWFERSTPLPHEMVCQLTGEDALNDTTVVNVYGADLGLMIDYQARLHFIFGDTFGPDKWDWRSNTMAYSDDSNPSDGILLTGWITDTATHLAKELIHSQKIDYVEKTVIPTAAYSRDDCLYIFYMSVNHWGDAGDWTCNNASIAYSFDGYTFIESTNMSWPGSSNFIEWGYIKTDETAPSSGGFLYFLTTSSGRYHDCYLARVLEDQILNQSAYQYCAGLDSSNLPIWSTNHADAQPVIEAPTGEMSVMWNAYLERYMMIHLDDVAKKIVIRIAQMPWGPWSQPHTVITRPEYVGFYAPNIDPILVEDNGRIVYFTMSLWAEYNVYLMKVDLTRLWGIYHASCPRFWAASLYWIKEIHISLMNNRDVVMKDG